MKKSVDKNDINKKLLDHIASELVLLKIISSPYELTKHTQQGYMSQVYVLTSRSSQEFIVHIVKSTKQHVHVIYRAWEKVQAISALLQKETSLPISRIILAEKRGDGFFTVQTRLPGKAAGLRYIQDYDIIDRWLRRRSFYITQLQKITAAIHEIRLTGAGWPVVKNGKLTGTHKNWPDFFREEMPLWLRSFKKKENQQKYSDNTYNDMALYAKEVFSHIQKSSAILIHGDTANPGNFLVQNNKITGVIDWEWAMIGDPAWEFCDPGWGKNIKKAGLDVYFRASKIKKKDRKYFLDRIILFRPLWCLWKTHVHADYTDPIICETLRFQMKKALAEARNIKH